MTSYKKAVLYEDDFGYAEPGHVFYPPALGLIAPVLAELNGEEIQEPKSFNANIELYLDLIISRFRSFHDTHRAARQVHGAYRTKNRQYCLYLRSFSLGGTVLGTGFEHGRLMQQQGWLSTDRDFRKFLKASLAPAIESLSFINTFDLYPSGNESDDDYIRQVTIPSFRVLSHNWREVVREAARGAKFIVLNVQSATEGVEYELKLVRECGMAARTIVIGRIPQEIAPITSFYDIIDLESASFVAESAAARRLAQAIGFLSNDAFNQTNEVSDLSGLPCWVVDRQIDAAARSFDAETLANVAYDHYIPSSLASNWNLLTELFPKMIDEWRVIEAKMASGEVVTTGELVHALYSALRVFYLGITLERYHEITFALSTMGMAHRAITSTVKVMAACYRHAKQCAEWLGDSALTDFFADAHLRLAKEIEANAY